MCYFHVISNIKKKFASKIGLQAWIELHSYLSKIHMSRSVGEKKKLINQFSDRYKSESYDLWNYVNKQWFEDPFNKWQIYHNDPGLTNTNSNIESFNAAVKCDFFKRKRMTVYGAVCKIEEIVKYYSLDNRKFQLFPKFVLKLNNNALVKKLSDFKKIDKSSYSIKSSQTSNIYIIRLADKCCSCGYLKKKICIHSLAWSNLNGLNWFGPTYTAKSSKFYYKTKKGAKKGGRIKNSESAYIRDD